MDRPAGHDRPTSRRRGVTTSLAALVVVVAAVAVACAPAPPTPPGPGPLTPAGKATLTDLKRSHYGQLALDESARIAAGRSQPVVEFTVEQTPPSIFVNWVVPDAQAAAFADAADLPPGFSLAKVRILETDAAPQYWLSLNVYRVDGITTGLRAEWSTYVDDGGGEPRFMILRARAADGSLDPLGPLAPPEPILHGVDAGGTITTAMNRTELVGGLPVVTPDNLFSSTITLPAEADRDLVTPTREWFGANDFIYWLNGVNDRVFQNRTAHSPRLVSVDLDDVTLDDDSEWVPFLDPVPAHVLVYLDAIEFTISPWWNVTETDGLVDPATVASLRDLKGSIYGGLSNLTALNVITGAAEPSVPSTIESTPPSTHWHWRVPAGMVDDLGAAIGLPAGLDLAPVRLEEGDAGADHWLSLAVHRRSGDGAGLRAEWTTHVEDGSGVRTLVIESRSDATSLDPVELFSGPTPVAHEVVGGVLTTSVGAGGTAFSSSVPLPSPGTETDAVATREWVGAGELRYWRNGVADRVTRDSAVFDPRTSIDPATVTVTDGGTWSAFTAGPPERVWVDRSPMDSVTNPWWNLAGL